MRERAPPVASLEMSELLLVEAPRPLCLAQLRPQHNKALPFSVAPLVLVPPPTAVRPPSLLGVRTSLRRRAKHHPSSVVRRKPQSRTRTPVLGRALEVDFLGMLLNLQVVCLEAPRLPQDSREGADSLAATRLLLQLARRLREVPQARVNLCLGRQPRRQVVSLEI